MKDAVGPEGARLAKDILKGRAPLSALTPAQRQAAAQWYRGRAETVGNVNAEAARLFNIARAEFLEGTRTSIPAKLGTFIEKELK